MDFDVLNSITMAITANKKAALAILTNEKGSSPGKSGFIMAIFEDGSKCGTIGGGNLEHKVNERALQCIKENSNANLSYELNESGPLGMSCGGKADIFIKVFQSKPNLLIIGGGHIGLELYKQSLILGFQPIVFDNRLEYANDVRFPEAKIYFGEYEDTLTPFHLPDDSYVVIVTHGHKYDQLALKILINKIPAYIGMIGSKNKVAKVNNNLLALGYEASLLEKVYAPIGLALGGETPSEIALSIISEIVMIKNKGKLEHLKNNMHSQEE